MKASVRFRLKDNKPYSIEKISGYQFRCGICGKIFFTRNNLYKHLENEADMIPKKLKFPELNKNISVSLLYSADVKDLSNPKYVKVKLGEKFLKIK
ncbi:hypothetical protein MNBD_IGNAVI01-2302 [hydrothermal vent metagenome]|uniref:C2H2-type domain-containing protein n=1 Tax=hydrothermal vent metagenome TaxID=652676 RepID=A0A3B1CR55_9ZZZZ